MKKIILIFLLLEGIRSSAQFKVISVDSSTVPAYAHYKGNILEGLRWTDKMGDNIVILTDTGPFFTTATDDSDTMKNEQLFAYHYILQGDSAKLVWRIFDFVSECDFDMKADFVDSTFGITDLDNNGIAEIWVMYKVSCQSDVSPVSMKIIMYEADKKFAARGAGKVKVSANEYMGGEYSFDDAFKNGPEAFRKFANELWQKNILEAWL